MGLTTIEMDQKPSKTKPPVGQNLLIVIISARGESTNKGQKRKNLKRLSSLYINKIKDVPVISVTFCGGQSLPFLTNRHFFIVQNVNVTVNVNVKVETISLADG